MLHTKVEEPVVNEIKNEIVNKAVNKTRFKIGDYIVSKKTLPIYARKKDGGKYKKLEWIIASVPSIIVEIQDDCIIIQNFCKGLNRLHIITNNNFKYLRKCKIENGNIYDLLWYPEGKLKISEFDERKKVDLFNKKVNKLIKSLPDNQIIKHILKDKINQLRSPQGAPCPTIPDIIKYDFEKLRNHPTKRVDNMIFNRCSRWTPPIPESYTYEEYRNSINFGLPIGTRPKDFCYPSELISTLKEMIRQILCFKNINPDTKQQIIEILELDASKCQEIHKCRWSGKEIDMLQYSSGYSSKNNFIEICHKDPNNRFLPDNMYWGFGESNRQQGGYSEEERVKQVLNLLKHNPKHLELFEEDIRELFK